MSIRGLLMGVNILTVRNKKHSDKDKKAAKQRKILHKEAEGSAGTGLRSS
jgi:hypothetical protein